jgi:signal transduction histidine kinase
LKMEGEVYRLKRLAEKSSSYLNSNNEKGLISFDYKEVPSINQLIGRILEDYRDHNISYKLSGQDQPMVLDVYWISICLKNIIENAIHHGAKPIMVDVEMEEKFLRIDVIDHGKYSRERKDAQSNGLGMGLSIVEKIMVEMKGKITVAQNPTIISLYLRQKV